MLNKIKYGAITAAVLIVIRAFLPDVDIPEGLADAITMVIVFVAQFFVRETNATVGKLSLK